MIFFLLPSPTLYLHSSEQPLKDPWTFPRPLLAHFAQFVSLKNKCVTPLLHLSPRRRLNDNDIAILEAAGTFKKLPNLKKMYVCVSLMGTDLLSSEVVIRRRREGINGGGAEMGWNALKHTQKNECEAEGEKQEDEWLNTSQVIGRLATERKGSARGRYGGSKY